jgi:large subunit ribosomal protein L13
MPPAGPTFRCGDGLDGLDGLPGKDGIPQPAFRTPHDDGEPPPVYCLVGRFRPFFSTVMTTSSRTFSPRPRDIERRWYVVDADGAVLGRLASEVAKILRGKHKPIFAPHMDTGDHVIVVNARGVRLTGGKENEKVYYRHSGYPGGLREIGYARLLAERPVLAVEKAVKGMLPKNRLGRVMITKLKVYAGADHPHEAQLPSPLALGAVPRWEGLPKPKPPRPKPQPAPKASTSGKASGSKSKTGPARGAKAAAAGRTRKASTSAQKKEGAPTRRRRASTARGKEAAKPPAKAGPSRRKKEAGTTRWSKTEES